ncbi:MAG TPA: TraB/GumN family protein [Telluria sp.]|nr:TraB/GumN family protein [Telluria sp.]
MIGRTFVTLGLWLLAASAWSQAAPEAPVAPEVTVVGQRPGPGLWKISNGENVLWVFGTYSPLPVKMQWRSHEVEAILARSQEFISPPIATPDIGKLQIVSMLPFAFGVNKLPDGKTLRDVLPADVYARWQPLKQKYLGTDDDIERLRPIFAADALYWAVLKEAGLENTRSVRETINRLVKQNKLKVTSPEFKFAIDNPRKALRDFKTSSLEDGDCFAKTLERLEKDIDGLRLRANAWAKGDLEAIQKLNFADREGACTSALLSSSAFKDQPGFQSIDARIKDMWLAAVDKALAANKSTFAVLGMKDILDPKGYVAALKEKGYVVEQPE